MGSPVENCVHGVPSYTDDAGTVHVATGARCVPMASDGWHDEDAPRIEPAAGGPGAGAYGAAPDPARDARRTAYQEQERRRAARALDRYVDALFASSGSLPAIGEVAHIAGDRFVEAVGDYVLSRLHHKSNYGAPPTVIGETTASACRNTDHEHFPGDPILESCRAHKGNYGVPGCGAPGPCYLTDCARDASGVCPRESAQHNADSGAADE